MKKILLVIASILLLAFIVLYKFPYTIVTVGDTEALKERIAIEDGYQSEGEFSLVFVTVYPSTAFNYLITFFSERKIRKVPYGKSEKYLGQLYTTSSVENANINLLRLLGEENIVIDYDEYISFVGEEVACDIRVGDEILSYDNHPLVESESYRNHVQAKNLPATLKLTLSSEFGEERDVECEITRYKDRNIIGYGFIGINELISTHEILNRVNADLTMYGGPSAGMAITLELLNQLVEEDLTKGYEIVATGTINYDGTIGQIGSADFKLKAAYKSGADYFFVPDSEDDDSNYKIAMKYKIENDLDIEVVKINHINDAIEFLEGLSYEEAN